MLIDETGAKVGIISVFEGLRRAAEVGLDLVEVGPNASPPVCKIMDYGQLKYQEKKKTQEAKKKQVVIKVKEIKIRPKIEAHDFEVKTKQLVQFIEDGCKVRIVVKFKGREVVYADSSEEILRSMYDSVKEKAHIELEPSLNNYTMTIIIAPGVK